MIRRFKVNSTNKEAIYEVEANLYSVKEKEDGTLHLKVESKTYNGYWNEKGKEVSEYWIGDYNVVVDKGRNKFIFIEPIPSVFAALRDPSAENRLTNNIKYFERNILDEIKEFHQ